MTKHIKHVSRRELLRAIDAQAERITALEETANQYLLLLCAVATEVDGPIIFEPEMLQAVADAERGLHVRSNDAGGVCFYLEPVPVAGSDSVPIAAEEPANASDDGPGIPLDPPLTVARDPGDEHRDEPIVYVGGDGRRVRPLL